VGESGNAEFGGELAGRLLRECARAAVRWSGVSSGWLRTASMRGAKLCCKATTSFTVERSRPSSRRTCAVSREIFVGGDEVVGIALGRENGADLVGEIFLGGSAAVLFLGAEIRPAVGLVERDLEFRDGAVLFLGWLEELETLANAGRARAGPEVVLNQLLGRERGGEVGAAFFFEEAQLLAVGAEDEALGAVADLGGEFVVVLRDRVDALDFFEGEVAERARSRDFFPRE